MHQEEMKAMRESTTSIAMTVATSIAETIGMLVQQPSSHHPTSQFIKLFNSHLVIQRVMEIQQQIFSYRKLNSVKNKTFAVLKKTFEKIFCLCNKI